MCQLCWAMVPSCLVKHQSRCHCEGFLLLLLFLEEINIYVSQFLSKADDLPYVSGPHPISWKPQEKRLGSHEEGILPPDGLQTQAAALALPWISSLLACPAEFGLPSLCILVNQFLKVSFFLSLFPSHPPSLPLPPAPPTPTPRPHTHTRLV